MFCDKIGSINMNGVLIMQENSETKEQEIQYRTVTRITATKRRRACRTGGLILWRFAGSGWFIGRRMFLRQKAWQNNL